ncbi:hypothetical protein, partial [Salmonella sp. s51944]|uniref:hypothetical protein n=1 Tax=Salmonella sp. s51944 TaxID=3159655 RepID=UPI00397F782B
LTSICMLLVLLAATAVIAFPAENDFRSISDLFGKDVEDGAADVKADDTVDFDRERRRMHRKTCLTECYYCTKIYHDYSLLKCSKSCSRGNTDYGCDNLMHFV